MSNNKDSRKSFWPSIDEQLKDYVKKFNTKQMNIVKYKVSRLINDEWQVLDRETEHSLYQGSLSDCESWIRLQESGCF